eukprot:TRINITY_DN89_c0_g1_i1.p1 TRINITY_DN89_c0_g1~~TRINITY_DN89_c0_g1_i1.p1  ORF type:complete len:102 (+),score=66.98 TRINITY_DN89_c0_g1_i1:89-394(+)
MIRRPPRSTQSRSSAASDVYKRQIQDCGFEHPSEVQSECIPQAILGMDVLCQAKSGMGKTAVFVLTTLQPVSYTHLRAHETVLDLVCRLLLEKKKKKQQFQ